MTPDPMTSQIRELGGLFPSIDSLISGMAAMDAAAEAFDGDLRQLVARHHLGALVNELDAMAGRSGVRDLEALALGSAVLKLLERLDVDDLSWRSAVWAEVSE